MTNNPQRGKSARIPRFRHGVCENESKGIHFGWTERSENGRYLCPECLAGEDVDPASDSSFYLRPVCMMPLYVGSDLLSRDELNPMIDQIARDYLESGRMPSSPDGRKSLGYDYGLLLYNLTRLGHPAASEVFKRMMGLRDETGAWSEFYLDEKPHGTLCRPWESAINIEAAIQYVMSVG